MKYKLSDCITIISGGTPRKSEESYWSGNIPWITVKDFNGKYVSTITDYITLEGLRHSSANLTEDQDILISARGTVGKVMMVGAGYTFNQFLVCEQIDLYYCRTTCFIGLKGMLVLLNKAHTAQSLKLLQRIPLII